MNESYTCGVCGNSVYPDDDHVEVDVETVRMCDRNDEDDYMLHVGCAMRTFGAWSDPA